MFSKQNLKRYDIYTCTVCQHLDKIGLIDELGQNKPNPQIHDIMIELHFLVLFNMLPQSSEVLAL